jgi:adenosine deaminase
MIAQGLKIMLNSDDPAMFHTDIGKEYVDFCGQNGYGPDVVRTLVLNGVEATWLDPTGKSALRKTFEAELDALDAELEVAP